MALEVIKPTVRGIERTVCVVVVVIVVVVVWDIEEM